MEQDGVQAEDSTSQARKVEGELMFDQTPQIPNVQQAHEALGQVAKVLGATRHTFSWLSQGADTELDTAHDRLLQCLVVVNDTRKLLERRYGN